MHQFSRDEALALGFEGLGAIDDPSLLVATGTIAALAVRYIVRTGQLQRRFPGRDLLAVFRLVERNAVVLPWPFDVSQRMPLEEQGDEVDRYLDALDKVSMR